MRRVVVVVLVMIAVGMVGCAAATGEGPPPETPAPRASDPGVVETVEVEAIPAEAEDVAEPEDVAEADHEDTPEEVAEAEEGAADSGGEDGAEPEPAIVLDTKVARAAPPAGRAGRLKVKVSTPATPGARAAAGRSSGRASPGSEEALGTDPESALGTLMGTKVGESYGYGGLGLRGTGRGGGGTGDGTIGLGSLRTIGHGAGGGSGSGYGRGSGAMAGRAAGSSPARARGATPSRAAPPQVTTPLLTAATVPDVDRRGAYLDYLQRHPGEAQTLRLDLTRRVRFRVIDQADRPVNDARVVVMGGGHQVEGRTRADGYWDLFPSVSAPGLGGEVRLYVQSDDQTRMARITLPASGDGRDVHVRFPRGATRGPEALDLAFLIDVTGSMGDELAYINREVAGIVARVNEAAPQTSVRVGATLYRDRGDARALEQIPFTGDTGAFTRQLGLVRATGGGDYPEDMNAGLAAVMRTLQWRQGNAARVLVVIADAPPQTYTDFPYSYRHAMAEASTRGVRILPVAASGADRVVEYLFRAMGAFTGTPYVYLTDDSGVGNPHMEADTDRIHVEMFAELLTRLLIADLQGHGMHEPEAS